MCRASAFPEKIIATSVGDCRMYKAPPSSTSKPGTPAALQEERAVKANFPASTSSLSFFIASFAHCFRLGLLMSPMRWVGCFPGVRHRAVRARHAIGDAAALRDRGVDTKWQFRLPKAANAFDFQSI